MSVGFSASAGAARARRRARANRIEASDRETLSERRAGPRGQVIGLAICAVFWAAAGAAVLFALG